jgi:ABC-type lipoprotein release transport system permease subunit
MLGVATLIVVMAVMNGFRKELLDKILGLNGHLLIQPLESPLTDWQQVTERVAAMALTLSLLATVYPSWRAARLDPVETLRYE